MQSMSIETEFSPVPNLKHLFKRDAAHTQRVPSAWPHSLLQPSASSTKSLAAPLFMKVNWNGAIRWKRTFMRTFLLPQQATRLTASRVRVRPAPTPRFLLSRARQAPEQSSQWLVNLNPPARNMRRARSVA
mmetsp:Transcript_11993/g.37346  ORF Transcript_11993/g.37346 Transcript_11993/m.37346 type:complete len:131 (+) Transcript_11993:356-748(+)